jgi:hypothetical protein
MEEIVKLVATKLGISEDIARQAVQLVLGQLKQHFPAPIASQIDNLMTGKAGLADMANLDLGDLDKGTDLLGKLGGLFGKK